MPSTSLLHDELAAAFPDLTFESSDDFRWLPTKQIVQFDAGDQFLDERLLHEVAHSLLAHTTYSRDIELIGMERDAWHYARTTLAPHFKVDFASGVVEDDMDTYRDWLHARSTCPHCTATGLQTTVNEYSCVACGGKWRVNRAIGCQLRRYKQK